MGTPEFAKTALEAIHNAGHNVIGVFSQPPKPVGRKQILQNSPVHEYAEQNGIRLLEIWYWDYDNIETILNKNI